MQKTWKAQTTSVEVREERFQKLLGAPHGNRCLPKSVTARKVNVTPAPLTALQIQIVFLVAKVNGTVFVPPSLKAYCPPFLADLKDPRASQKNLREIAEDDIDGSDTTSRPSISQTKPARESFEASHGTDLFNARHVESCDSCDGNSSIAPLIYCQGCSYAYHQDCLGNRSNREHLVTKVDSERLVVQCKRYVDSYQEKDRFAPNLARC